MVQKKTAAQLLAEREIMIAVWELLKAYHGITVDAEEWGEVIERADRISRAAAGGPVEEFAKAQALAALIYLEDLSRERARGKRYK